MREGRGVLDPARPSALLEARPVRGVVRRQLRRASIRCLLRREEAVDVRLRLAWEKEVLSASRGFKRARGFKRVRQGTQNKSYRRHDVRKNRPRGFK